MCGGGAHSALNRLHASDVAWTSTSAGQNYKRHRVNDCPSWKSKETLSGSMKKMLSRQTDSQAGRQTIRQQSLSQCEIIVHRSPNP